MNKFPLEYAERGVGEPFHALNGREEVKWMADFCECDGWYIVRNGDPVGLLMPRGSKLDDLPRMAMGYIAFKHLWSRA